MPIIDLKAHVNAWKNIFERFFDAFVSSRTKQNSERNGVQVFAMANVDLDVLLEEQKERKRHKKAEGYLGRAQNVAGNEIELLHKRNSPSFLMLAKDLLEGDKSLCQWHSITHT